MVSDCDKGMGATLGKTGVRREYGWLHKMNFLVKAIVLKRGNEGMPGIRVQSRQLPLVKNIGEIKNRFLLLLKPCNGHRLFLGAERPARKQN